MTLRFSTFTTDSTSVVYILPPDGGVLRPSLTVAGLSWTSFATGRVITLVDVRILADLAIPSLPSAIPFAGCCPPKSTPNHSLLPRLGKISISVAASDPTDILVSNFATISRGAADGIAIGDSIAGGHVLLAAILGHGLQLPGSQRTHDQSVTETAIKGGVRGVHPPRMSVKRLSEDLPQRFLDRADEALPVASHPRGSLRDEFPVDAVAYQLTLDSVHVHVSPELPQLRRSGFERAKIIRLDDLRSSSPGDEPSERLHHSGRRHLWDQLQMHCP
ncbi:hypothetical protein T03_1825 [Trichinella britovi]|uniref:Uncharacterized protein n=1 Tax=Trichinella britovi TaxID=45882 RepID=A0A0V1CJG2_TRIBR|nr:hypothetical protein T03_1825 [Trichinella britovi]